jgi:Secretion system C-terminal sorting domain
MRKIFLYLAATILHNYTFSQSNSPEVVVSGLPADIYSFDFHNDYIYYTKIAGNGKHLGRVNHTSTNPMYEIFVDDIFPIGLTVHNSTLFYGELYPARISKIDLSQNALTSNPLPISFTDDFPWRIKVFDNDLHFSESQTNLKKVPLDNLSQDPTSIAQFTHQYDFIKEGNFYFTTTFDGDQLNNIFKFDFSDTANPILQNIAQIFEPTSLVKFGNYLFVGTNDSKIYRINLTQSSTMPELFYEITNQSSYIGQLISFNQELYFSLNEANPATQVLEGKIMKFTQSQLSDSDFLSTENFEIVPNPASTTLNIDTALEVEHIDFYDFLGKKIEVKRVGENSFDISNLENGTYLIRIKNETLRFIKK